MERDLPLDPTWKDIERRAHTLAQVHLVESPAIAEEQYDIAKALYSVILRNVGDMAVPARNSVSGE